MFISGDIVSVKRMRQTYFCFSILITTMMSLTYTYNIHVPPTFNHKY